MKYDKNLTQNQKILAYIIGISFFIVLPFILDDSVLNNGNYNFHIQRIYHLADAIMKGDLFPALYPQQLVGFGYATSIFYSNLFLRLPALLYILSGNMYISIIFFLFILNIATCYLSFWSAKELGLNEKKSMLAAFLYTLNPYRIFVLLYIRGAVGEMFGVMLLPVLIAALVRLYKDKKWLLLGITMTVSLYTHLLSTFIFGLFIIIFIILNIKKLKKDIIFGFIKAALLSIVLCLYKLASMLEISQAVKLNLNDSTYGSLANVDFPIENMTNLNLINLSDITLLGILVIFSILSWIYIKSGKFSKKNLLLMLCGWTLYISTNLFPWHYVEVFCPLVSKIQMLSRLSMFFFFFASIYIAKYIKEEITKGLCGVVLVSSYLMPIIVNQGILSDYYEDTSVVVVHRDMEILNDLLYSVCAGEYLPEKAKLDITNGNTSIFEGNYNSVLKNDKFIYLDNEKVPSQINSHYTNTDYILEKPMNAQVIEIPKFYYPGYVIKINGKQVDYHEGNRGRIEVENSIQDPIKIINVIYKGTKIQSITKHISLSAFIGLALLTIRKNKKKRMDKI